MTTHNKLNLFLLAHRLRIKTKSVPGLNVVCEPFFRAGNTVYDFLKGCINAQRRPIYIVGLPRSGTTCVASIMNTAHSVKYFHEPFNCKNVPGASKYCMRYFPSDSDSEFSRRCREALSGRVRGISICAMLSRVYKQHPWWPGRVIVKDVCSCMALEAIYRNAAPIMLIVVRHPCGVAASWHRLQYDIDLHFEILCKEEELWSEILKPYQSIFSAARGFWQKMGALWGAVHYILIRQQRLHPDWLLIKHEDFCDNAHEKFQRLFQILCLDWTTATDALIQMSTQTNSLEPYLVHRISEDEPGKWKTILGKEQIDQVLDFVAAFGISMYSD